MATWPFPRRPIGTTRPAGAPRTARPGGSGPRPDAGERRLPAARQVVNARYSGARPLAVLRARASSDVRAGRALGAPQRGAHHGALGRPQLRGLLHADRRAGGRPLRPLPDRGRRRPSHGAGGRGRAADRRLHEPGGAGADACPPARAPPWASEGSPWAAAWGSPRARSAPPATTSSAVTVVTADGRALACDARRNADLFWACRGGGGGNFGIATSFTLPDPPGQLGGSYFFAWLPVEPRGRGVVAAWQRWAPHAPDELFSICSLCDRRRHAHGAASSASTWASTAALRRTPAGLTLGRCPPSDADGGHLDLPRPDASGGPGAWASPPAECRRAAARTLLRGQVATTCSGRSPARASRRWWRRWSGARRSRRTGSGAHPARLLRGRDQPGGAGRDGLRPPRRALLDPVPAPTGPGRRPRPRGVSWIRGFVPRRCGRSCRASRTRTTSTRTSRAGRTPTTAPTSRGWCDVKTTYDPDEVFRFRQGIRAA